jgi:hypothetical protein
VLSRVLASVFPFQRRFFLLSRRNSAESAFSRLRKLGRSHIGPFPRRSVLIAFRTPRNSDSIGIVVRRMAISPMR